MKIDTDNYMDDNDYISDEKSKYVLDFSLSFVDLNSKTTVHKEFDNWTGKEFETIIQEIRQCLLCFGYGQQTIDSYILPVL